MFDIPRISFVKSLSCFLLLLLVSLRGASLRAAEPFQDQVLPFLSTYCIKCHNKEKTSGELDLTRFTSAEKLTEDFRQWETRPHLPQERGDAAREGEAAARRTSCRDPATLEQVLLKEARKLAGDPGVVPSRRLSNAEYDYTIRDLTGVDIRPAASFPRRSRVRRRLQQHRRSADDVADAVQEILRGRGIRRRPRLAHHDGIEIRPAPRGHVRGSAEVLRVRRSSTSTNSTRSITKRISPRCGSTATAPRHARRRRRGVGAESASQPEVLRDRFGMYCKAEPSTDKFLLQLASVSAGMLCRRRRIRWSQSRGRASGSRSKSCCRYAAPQPADVPTGDGGHCRERGQRADRAPRTPKENRCRSAIRSTRTREPAQHLRWEFRNVGEKPTIKLVIQVAGIGDAKADGYVVLKGAFTTTEQTTDGKKTWSLRSIMAATRSRPVPRS